MRNVLASLTEDYWRDSLSWRQREMERDSDNRVRNSKGHGYSIVAPHVRKGIPL
jgi:hypothetical protein